MNEEFLIYQAKSFYNAYIMLEQIKNEEDPLLLYVPMLVNGAFAVELILKAILTKQKIEYKNEHNLKVLFDKLPLDIQKELWDFLEKKKPEYADHKKRETELIIMSDAFVKWRYCFEDKNAPAFDSSFLSAFANAAIYIMFHLGYNAFFVESNIPTETYDEIEKKFEDNRNSFFQSSTKYINSKEKGGKV